MSPALAPGTGSSRAVSGFCRARSTAPRRRGTRPPARLRRRPPAAARYRGRCRTPPNTAAARAGSIGRSAMRRARTESSSTGSIKPEKPQRWIFVRRMARVTMRRGVQRARRSETVDADSLERAADRDVVRRKRRRATDRCPRTRSRTRRASCVGGAFDRLGGRFERSHQALLDLGHAARALRRASSTTSAAWTAIEKQGEPPPW